MDEAIRECSLDLLKHSYLSLTTLTAYKHFSHKLIHVQVRDGYLKGAAEILMGYIEDALLSKYTWSRGTAVENFLAGSAENANLASFREKILEKRMAHTALQKGGHFRC